MLDHGFYNMDCMEGMREFPDGFFDLAVTDPPYGINMDGGNVGYKGHNNFEKKSWDTAAPTQAYFNELSRVSKNQIVWGGNYMGLPASRCWIVWDKGEGFYGRTYAECELAWTSFDRNVRIYKRDPLAHKDYCGKIHPTQKPVALYQWILNNYAKPGDRILDTHVGSASSLIACHRLGLEYWGFEIDTQYYRQASERLEREKTQLSLFETPPEPVQETLF